MLIVGGSFACMQQEGCTWDATGSDCTGVAASCGAVLDCSQQQGCSTQMTCAGVPLSCGSLSKTQCSSQPGCIWGVPPLGGTGNDGGTDATLDSGSDVSVIDSPNEPIEEPPPPSCQGVTCDPSHDTQCVKNTCDPSTGQCSLQPLPNFTGCDDGLYCTSGDSCQNGTCVGGSQTPCFDTCQVCNETSKSCVIAPSNCEISGSCVTSGSLDPANACQSCQPTTSQTSWSPLPSGTTCVSSDRCQTATTCDGSGTCSGAPLVPQVAIASSPRAGALSGSVLSPSSFAHLRPVFQWRVPADACATLPTYDIQVDDSCTTPGWHQCSFSSPEASATALPTPRFQPSTDLPASTTVPVGTRYYWRVRACRGTACSAWSAPSYLDVGRAHSDLDGDGYSDLVVTQLNQTAWEGSVYFYRGSAAGLTYTSAWTMPSPIQSARQYFGAVAVTGDLNADGYADIVVNAPSWNGSSVTSKAAEGVVYVWYGGPNGPRGWSANATIDANPGTWAWPWTFGYALAAAGDVDDDGYGDLVVNAVVPSGASPPALVYAGSSTGVPTTATYSLPALPNGIGEPLGVAAVSDGDLDGDGIADIVLSNGGADQSGHGGAYVWRGTSQGTFGAPYVLDENFGPPGEAYPQAVFTSVDLNGDTIADLLYAFQDFYEFYGQWPAGVSNPYAVHVPNPGTTFWFGGWFTAAYFAGPNAPQIAVGAATSQQVNGSGFVYLYHPGNTAPFAILASPAAANTGQGFGAAVQRPGDVDADGYDDLVVGDPYTNSGAGAAYLYRGSASGLPSTPSQALANPGSGTLGFGEALGQ